jgi:hypothetical protein
MAGSDIKPGKAKRKRPERTDAIREQDRKRQKAASERKAKRAKQLGARSFKGELYGATANEFDVICKEADAEQMELITNTIHRLFELRQRDPIAFAAMTSHEALPEVWHG